jgi:hypothetical protein
MRLVAMSEVPDWTFANQFRIRANKPRQINLSQLNIEIVIPKPVGQRVLSAGLNLQRRSAAG